jgi:predicted phosphodiesterase
MKITLISDTHSKHGQITNDLPGGDLIIHAGALSSMGYQEEHKWFFEWYKKLPYDHKVFIAGNHDWGFQDNSNETSLQLKNYPEIDYLQDAMYVLGDDYTSAVKIYGTPWQPRFHDWAFNADRGEDIKQHWDKIPTNGVDILVTHGPAWGFLDKVHGQGLHLGCEDLAEAIARVKPKIHVCGHIHTGHGYYFNGETHFFNAAVLDERYAYTQDPFTFEWNPETNEIEFL